MFLGAELQTLLIPRRLRAGLVIVKHRRTRKEAEDGAAVSVSASFQAVSVRNQSSSLSDVQQILHAARSGKSLFPECLLRSVICII